MIFMPVSIPIHEGEESEKKDPYPKVIEHKMFTHGNDDEYTFYNPGNAMADVRLLIFGRVYNGGVTFTNNTTKQKCRLSTQPSRMIYYYYACDSMTGECYYYSKTKNEKIATDYLPHDYGFIQLAPGENKINVNPDSTCDIGFELDYKATFN